MPNTDLPVSQQDATTDRATTADEIAESIERGTTWLSTRIGPDGNPGAGHCHYYRVPWSLALSGHRAEASAVLSWVEREVLDELGDLREEVRGGFGRQWASYPLAILASGAWHLERYDTAQRLTARLRDSYQSSQTGGAYAAHPAHRENGRQDLFPTAQLGMTGLTTGDFELAHGAFSWLTRLFEAQKELPNRLFTAMDDSGRLLQSGGDEALEWQLVTDFAQPRQAFYNPGIAAAFLGRYYMATRETGALELAMRYIALTVSGTEAQFDHTDSVQVCKFAWGAAVLSEATGDQGFLEHARRMGSWFIAAQNPNGSWDNSPFLMTDAIDRDSARTEITAEFVQHQISIANALGGWRRPHPLKGTRT